MCKLVSKPGLPLCARYQQHRPEQILDQLEEQAPFALYLILLASDVNYYKYKFLHTSSLESKSNYYMLIRLITYLPWYQFQNNASPEKAVQKIFSLDNQSIHSANACKGIKELHTTRHITA